MTRKTDVIMTSCATAVVVAVVFTAVRDYRNARAVARIRTKTEADLKRIWKAGAIVEQKVKRGDYDGRTIDDIMNDFQYYQQVFNFLEQES